MSISTTLVSVINMNPFNHDTPPLFVQQDSPISKVELLIKDLRQAHGQKRDLESRDEPFAKDVRGLEHQSEIGAEDVSGKSTASTGDDWPNLDESQESNINLHWVSLRRPVELESSIRVCPYIRFGVLSILMIVLHRLNSSFVLCNNKLGSLLTEF